MLALLVDSDTISVKVRYLYANSKSAREREREGSDQVQTVLVCLADSGKKKWELYSRPYSAVRFACDQRLTECRTIRSGIRVRLGDAAVR